MAESGYLLTASDRAELKRIRQKLDKLSGPGVINSPNSITISPPQSRAIQQQVSGSGNQWGKPTAALTMTGVYTMRLVTIDAGAISSGGSSFQLSTLGTAGTTDYTLVNLAEIEATGHALTDGSDQPAGGWVLPVWPSGLTDASQSNRPVYFTYAIGIGCPA